MHSEEIAIMVCIFLVILSIRWYNKISKHTIDGIATLTQEALRFEQAIKEEKHGDNQSTG